MASGPGNDDDRPKAAAEGYDTTELYTSDRREA